MRALVEGGSDARAAQLGVGNWLAYHVLGADQAMAAQIRGVPNDRDATRTLR